MKESQGPFIFRKLLIGVIILVFIYLSSLFAVHYKKYRQLETHLNSAYAAAHKKTGALYQLFSTYSEAENYFRSYSLNFDPSDYQAYKSKLDTIKHTIDSLASLPIENAPLVSGNVAIQARSQLVVEFVKLQKTVDALVFFARDSLSHTAIPHLQTATQNFKITDSALTHNIEDSLTLDFRSDTLVHKKAKLLDRIFNAKDDTLVIGEKYEKLLSNKTHVILRNARQVLLKNQLAYKGTLKQLQESYTLLRRKEQELINANYLLLTNLKKGLDKIIDSERTKLQDTERSSMALHKENAKLFGRNLITALGLMALMIILILIYQYKAGKYEKEIQQEKDYSRLLAGEKSNVLANVCHEVRTPLNALIGVVDILRKKEIEHEIAPAFLDAITQEIALINSTVTDILSLSKMEEGALALHNDFFSPRIMLEELLLLHSHQAMNKGLQLTCISDLSKETEIYNNEFRIKQIVSNLISNAIKYTPEGSVRVVCELIPSPSHDRLIIRVVDTGVGISKDKQQYLFRQYYAGSDRGKPTGFGLGLYISKLFSEQINAEITVHSGEGEGTSFTLSIPVSTFRQTRHISPVRSLADLPQSLRIVLIDDNRMNLMYLEHIFQGFPNVISFDDPTLALQYMDSAEIDLIITDLHMPEVNGWDILDFVRAKETLKGVIVLALTADNLPTPGLQESKENNTFQGTLSKPLVVQELITKIFDLFCERRNSL